MNQHQQIFVYGAGIIGCSIALEVAGRGFQVTILERDTPFRGASTAAAGMLAADDPHNPGELSELSHYSLELYPDFLDQIERLSHQQITYQTQRTWQYDADGVAVAIEEQSLDPRELAATLLAAVRNCPSIELRDHAAEIAVAPDSTTIYAAGSWTGQLLPLPVCPRKGQMLRVSLPSGMPLSEVHRSEEVYVVPRTHGADAGTALIGATVEDVGFDTQVDDATLAGLRHKAATLSPALAFLTEAPMIESWAGLRPATPDNLPLIGALGGTEGERRLVATGHFRNGILLAPATAVILADLFEEKTPSIDIGRFSPRRFLAQ